MRMQLKVILALAAVGTACGARTELDPTLSQSAGGVGSFANQSTGGKVAAVCPGFAGPKMVRLPEGYCIDSTEVTRAQYQAWLDTHPSTYGQVPVCTTNLTFMPESNCMARACQIDCGNHPQVCVDWCDAFAYCKAAGKRLCGKIAGGPLAGYGSEFADVSVSQWFNACTSRGSMEFTYGSAHRPGRCNDYEFGANSTVPVGRLTGCHSPIEKYSGVYDLTGNAQEWEDACSDANYCHIRGGDYGTAGEVGTVCNADVRTARDSASQFTGFRCCS